MEIKVFQDINKYQRCIDELYERRKGAYYAVQSPRLSGIKSTTPADPTAKALEKLTAIDEQIAKAEIKKAELLGPALDWMYSTPVPVDVRRILINKYFCCLSWEATGRAVGSSASACRMMIYRYFSEKQAR